MRVFPSKSTFLTNLTCDDVSIRQQSVIALFTQFPINDETITATSPLVADVNPFVRSLARLHLARFYRGNEDRRWIDLWVADVADEKLDTSARLASYLELIRLEVSSHEFLELSKRIDTLTLDDIDYKVIEAVRCRIEDDCHQHASRLDHLSKANERFS